MVWVSGRERFAKQNIYATCYGNQTCDYTHVRDLPHACACPSFRSMTTATALLRNPSLSVVETEKMVEVLQLILNTNNMDTNMQPAGTSEVKRASAPIANEFPSLGYSEGPLSALKSDSGEKPNSKNPSTGTAEDTQTSLCANETPSPSTGG